MYIQTFTISNGSELYIIEGETETQQAQEHIPLITTSMVVLGQCSRSFGYKL